MHGARNNNSLIGDFLGYSSIETSSSDDVYLAYQGGDIKLVNNVLTSIGAGLTTFKTRNIEVDNNTCSLCYI